MAREAHSGSACPTGTRLKRLEALQKTEAAKALALKEEKIRLAARERNEAARRARETAVREATLKAAAQEQLM